jgi:hypothetical protein
MRRARCIRRLLDDVVSGVMLVTAPASADAVNGQIAVLVKMLKGRAGSPVVPGLSAWPSDGRRGREPRMQGRGWNRRNLGA